MKNQNTFSLKQYEDIRGNLTVLEDEILSQLNEFIGFMGKTDKLEVGIDILRHVI